MVPTMILPESMTVSAAAERCRVALEELLVLEASHFALAHWLCNSYRNALVVGGREHWPFALRLATPLEVAVEDAKRQVVRARRAACAPDGSFVANLPARVHVVRTRDRVGAIGFSPIDVRGASLAARGLSLLLADYLTYPERYMGASSAA